MRRYIRANTPGATYFFTVTLQDRSSRSLVDHIDLLRRSASYVKQRHPFQIDAMVVLPDHLHALWTLPPGDHDFATRWMLLKQWFTKGVAGRASLESRGDKGERVLWQRRYWEHQVRDEEDFRRHVDYIHFNPVKHGWAQRAGEWPHSSFHRFVREGKLDADWGQATETGSFGE
jgi:putative transposase